MTKRRDLRKHRSLDGLPTGQAGGRRNVLGVPRDRSSRCGRSTKGQRRTRGPKLDERAAVIAYSVGKTLAQVARAAGSRASSDRNARRIGHKIVQRVLNRGEMLDRFAAVGVVLDSLCENIAERLKATRTILLANAGQFTDRVEVPDWQARAKAAQQFMQLTGLLDLPTASEGDDAPGPLAGLTDDELVALRELVDVDENDAT